MSLRGLTRTLPLALAAVGLVVAHPAGAAVAYPASDGSDGVCAFPYVGAPTIYTFNTDTGQVSNPDTGFTQLGSANGTLRTVNCTTFTVAPNVTVNIAGSRAPDFRATGAVDIDGILNASASGTVPGPGTAVFSASAGSGQPGAGPSNGAGGGLGAPGGGAMFGGGGGGGGIAGGGGGAGGVSMHGGGTGGGPTGGPGGVSTSEGGDAGTGGAAGAQSGGNAGPGSGGGGGGGSYGDSSPFHPGSGGGGGGGRSTAGSGGSPGGGGGGAIRISGATTIEVGAGGSIRADGTDGFPGQNSSGTAGGSGGGGSGGSIQLFARQVDVLMGGALLARGGVGGAATVPGGSGGMGGPGRIDVAKNTGTIVTANPAPTTAVYSYSITAGRTGDGSGIVTSSPAGIDCGSDCVEAYNPGTVVSLTPTAASGSTFSGWSGACSGTGPCQVALDSDKSATAGFDAPDVVPAGPSGSPLPPADMTKPRLGALRFSRSVFRAAARVRFSLSEPARVRFTVERRSRGRRVGGRCVKATRSNRTRRACVRWVKVRGSFTVAGRTGANSLTFRGRVGGRRLRPGVYRLIGQATDAAANRSAVERRAFRIVR